MKKILLVVIGIGLCFSFFAAIATSAQENATNAFFAKNYDWTFGVKGIKQEPKNFEWSWNIVCDPDRTVLPEKGKNTSFNWVCRQKDPSYWTVVLWRLPSVKPETIERRIYKAMSNGFGYDKVTCHEGIFSSAVDRKGIIRDCEVLLQPLFRAEKIIRDGGTFYASFYHFSMPMPAGGSFVDKNGKRQEFLDFTIFVQNTDSSNPAVGERIREIVSSIQVVKK